MRRWAGVAVGVAAVLALAGCGVPMQRDLVGDWPKLGPAKGFVPETGACHTTIQDVGYLSGYNPVDCTQPHRAETLYVGTLTGADADRGTPPRAGSAGMRAARAACDRQVSKAVDADWRSGRLAVSVVFPSAPAWTGGARWFRCDVSEVDSLDDASVVTRSTTLRNALGPDSALAHRCFNPKLAKDDIELMRPVACTAKHHAEFVGVYPAPDISYAEFTRTPRRAHHACQGLIAKYVQVPDNSDLQYRAGTIFYHPSEQEWQDGNRGVQCFLWLDDRTVTRSLKGAGTRGLPIR